MTLKLPTFTETFVDRPQFFLSCLALAMHQFIIDKYNILIEKLKKNKINQSSANESMASNSNASQLLLDMNGEESNEALPSILSTQSIPMIKIRVLNYRKITKIKHLKANMYDKFVSIMGTVTRISTSKPFVTRLAFECAKCNSTFVNKIIIQVL